MLVRWVLCARERGGVMAGKRTAHKPLDGNLTEQRMIRFTEEDVAEQNTAAEIEGRPWANAARKVLREWARRVLAEAAAKPDR